MKSILETCTPRNDLLTGAFNPEIFTANLLQVIEYYRNSEGVIQNIYTDSEKFFQEGTYPTEGMRQVLGNIFGRLAGKDAMFPAIQRLETAFGGGKTHTLIAATHIAFLGNSISNHTEDLLDSALLPEQGEIIVVGVSGDRVAIHETQGAKLIPYTLWGEIAYQVGGEALYRTIGPAATSRGSPGEEYFKTVFGGRKTLIMLDELAAYAARVEAAHPGAGSNVATFLMSLMQYAKDHVGVSVVMTLASQTDAFSRQTKMLASLVVEAKGHDMEKSDALNIAEKADDEVRSVVARDATTVVPVQGSEISRVLARRLFEHIDVKEARITADTYREMYEKTASLLPDSAKRSDFKDRMIAHYPFHPTFIEYLTIKLSTLENFQGTRGVLRILALTVRNLWEKRVKAPMIHACHIDLRDARISNELISRTDSAELLPIINADIGGADSNLLAAEDSNAAIADLNNPHPEGFPLYEYTWKTVFLHSLSGIDEGLSAPNFGINKQDALFAVTFPGLTPPQVEEALNEIKRSAYYLRYSETVGRYYAGLGASVNKALANIRKGLKGDDRVRHLLEETARKVVKSGILNFKVVTDVGAPEHLPDKTSTPVLGLVALDQEQIDPEEFITRAGPNVPRLHQNLVFLLVAETTLVKGDHRPDDDMLENQSSRALELKDRLQGTATDVLARKILADDPQSFGLSPASISADEFTAESRERANALITVVTQAYRNLWFPGPGGKIIRRELSTAGGEGGAPVIEMIKEILDNEGELVTSEHAENVSAIASISKFFFESKDLRTLDEIKRDFYCKRAWPVLAESSVLDLMIRSGVRHGAWCLFRMGDVQDIKPAEFFSRNDDVPFDLNLSEPGWSIVTPQGAKKRGWEQTEAIDPPTIHRWVEEEIRTKGYESVAELTDNIQAEHGDVPAAHVENAVDGLIRSGVLFVHEPTVDPETDSDSLQSSDQWILSKVRPEYKVITRAEAVQRGWISARRDEISLSGEEALNKVWPLVKTLGQLYSKGASSTIDYLELSRLALSNGATLDIRIENAGAADIRGLDELFELLVELTDKGEETYIGLDIHEPQEGCLLVKKLKDHNGEN